MRTKKASISPLRPHFKLGAVVFAVIISFGSIIYIGNLVEQIREREKRQIAIYAKSLEYLANETENSNFILILDEIIVANHTIPVILTDQHGNPEFYRNLSKADDIENEEKRKKYLINEIDNMLDEHDPILVTLEGGEGKIYGYKYIYYKNSFLLNRLRVYPYALLSIIGIFGIIMSVVFNYFRRAEQNRVWVGLARETAHQLGTPISSLMAWSEYFKDLYPNQQETLVEFDKDVDRLKVITDRFSSVGSVPRLEERNVTQVVIEMVSYLQKRLSSKINMTVTSFPNDHIMAWINPSLFAWVIENLCKNAADAVDGNGDISINILKVNEGKVAIDIADTGKGITKSKITNVFRAGFTTKKRGWGLGLTLAKRIIEQYHEGKIFVKHSELNKGTTFRIYLKG